MGREPLRCQMPDASGSRSLKTSRKLDQEVEAYLRADDIEAAAARVIGACGPAILGYLRVALGNEDAAQRAFTAFSGAVWQRLRRYRGECEIRVWTYRLAFQCAQRQRRTLRSTRSGPDRSGETRRRALGRTRTATVESMALAEHAELLRRELSVAEQTLLTLRLDKQLSWAEIALVLGISGASKSDAVAQGRFEKLVARLHRLAITRGFIAPGARLSGRSGAIPPRKATGLHLVERSRTHDA
jgi:RNA polymerase sigma-70 factor (ECF subfamily)